MLIDTVLHNAKVYTEGKVAEAGIAINSGRLVKIAKRPKLPSSSRQIDLRGNLVLPGLIDLHVHLRGQKLAQDESFLTGTSAAVAGGITAVLDMPNNQPVTMDSTSLRKRMVSARRNILADVGFYAAFPTRLKEIRRIVEAGAVGFKVYLNAPVGGLSVEDDQALTSSLIEASKLGVPVAFHAEDKETIEAAFRQEQQLGRGGVGAYLRVHSPEAEVSAVDRVLRIAQKSNAQIHFCHISSQQALVLIVKARQRGVKVSCEVTPHHLFSTVADLQRQGAIVLTNPPVRQKGIVERLWRGIERGVVDVVASDHAPHRTANKTGSSIWEVKPGVPGLETLLPLLLTEVNRGRLRMEELISLTAEKPAEVFHLQDHGFVKEGYTANLTVVDMKRHGRLDASSFQSKARYSPFDGRKVKGIPVKTFVNGVLVMEDGEIVGEAGVGRILRPHRNPTDSPSMADT